MYDILRSLSLRFWLSSALSAGGIVALATLYLPAEWPAQILIALPVFLVLVALFSLLLVVFYGMLGLLWRTPRWRDRGIQFELPRLEFRTIGDEHPYWAGDRYTTGERGHAGGIHNSGYFKTVARLSSPTTPVLPFWLVG